MNEEAETAPDSASQPDPDAHPVPSGPSTPPGGYSLETVDVTRLSEILTRTGGEEPTTRVLGEAIIKALITDILRAKLGFTAAYWQDGWGRETSWGRGWDRNTPTRPLPEVSKVVNRLIANVSLSADELEVIKQLDINLEE
ncbi:hypothetical protein [Amycolatopsis pigmentata]|uniref:Uncharacterized protein n=1 Tax=Amycolatopsis pigmentata TaxID=450801 RepID=A0ABW5G3D7_9PSEU